MYPSIPAQVEHAINDDEGAEKARGRNTRRWNAMPTLHELLDVSASDVDADGHERSVVREVVGVRHVVWLVQVPSEVEPGSTSSNVFLNW